MSLRVPDYLGHIVEAIERIERYTTGMDETAFLNSESGVCRTCKSSATN